MPELPEVETTRRGIAPYLSGRRVTRLVVRERRLRWPVPRALDRALPGATIEAVERRAKYLLLRTSRGTAILHLGMSGSLRLAPPQAPAGPHDHVEIHFDRGPCLRLRDPRRFGALLWIAGADPLRHPLLRDLGPEPLSAQLGGDYLHARARGRHAAVKSLLMDGRVVAGLGNIYANEALFRAGIHPLRAAGRVSRERYERLAQAIRAVLLEALEQGGTTLRDFRNGADRPGYFQQRLRVYQRDGVPCVNCAAPVRRVRSGQRSTFYCPRCQR